LELFWDSARGIIWGVLTSYGLRIIGGIIILIVGWVLAGWAGRIAAKAAARTGRIDRTLELYGAKMARLTVLAITIVAVLNNFGVATTSMVAFLGAMGLAVGLALRGTLSNVASGVVLLVLRPFKVDDAVELAGTAGKIVEIGLFATELKTFDGLCTVIPNSSIWGGNITNISRNGTRRIELVFGISYSDDMDKALAIIRDEVAHDERVLKEPEPVIEVVELADSSVNIWCRPWATLDDFFKLKIHLTKRVKERFDEEGITIPFPQRDVHHDREEVEKAA
jgi:small conductance mechanosensitive channel